MASFDASDPAVQAMRILEWWRYAPEYPFGEMGSPARSTFAEERREVLAAVLQSSATANADPEHATACSDLLRHLVRFHRPEGKLRLS